MATKYSPYPLIPAETSPDTPIENDRKPLRRTVSMSAVSSPRQAAVSIIALASSIRFSLRMRFRALSLPRPFLACRVSQHRPAHRFKVAVALPTDFNGLVLCVDQHRQVTDFSNPVRLVSCGASRHAHMFGTSGQLWQTTGRRLHATSAIELQASVAGSEPYGFQAGWLSQTSAEAWIF